MAVSLLAGIVISAVALYFSFQNVPLNELVLYIGSIRYLWIIPSTALVLLAFILRAVRWQIILSSSGKIHFFNAFHPLMIGFMINCILPGRIGEVARPVILKKRESIPFSTGLATVAIERVFDIGFILVLFIIVLLTIDIDPDLSMSFGDYHLSRNALVGIGSGMVQLSVLLLAGILMVSFSKSRQWINRSINGIPSIFFFAKPSIKHHIAHRFSTPLVGIIENFATGFSLITSLKNISICFGLTMLIWGISAYSYYLMAKGCPGISLSFLEITAVMIIICFFIALPSVPGFWGIWEAGGVFALSLFGIAAKDAAGYTLVNHVIQMFPVIIVGLISAIILGINILHVSKENM